MMRKFLQKEGDAIFDKDDAFSLLMQAKQLITDVIAMLGGTEG